MIYLASAYSANPEVYYKQTVEAVTALTAKGEYIFSPILHCRPMELDGGLPGDFAFWSKYNQHMLRKSDSVYVLLLDGWKDSKGVEAEIEYARWLNLPIYAINPDTLNREFSL